MAVFRDEHEIVSPFGLKYEELLRLSNNSCGVYSVSLSEWLFWTDEERISANDKWEWSLV